MASIEVASFHENALFSKHQVVASNHSIYSTQNELLLHNLLKFYNENENMDQMLKIINGESQISLRIIDWFVTNYAKKHDTVYNIPYSSQSISQDVSDIHQSKGGKRFKVYVDYKLKLRAYSKRRFDPFCRWERISVPYKNGNFIQTTLGQLNFFKWALENDVIRYIKENYSDVETDMNTRNNISKRSAKQSNTASSTSSVDSIGSYSSVLSAGSTCSDGNSIASGGSNDGKCGGGGGGGSSGGSDNKTRKKREELSSSAMKGIKKERVNIVLTFN
jgi:hypothetical protein